MSMAAQTYEGVQQGDEFRPAGHLNLAGTRNDDGSRLIQQSSQDFCPVPCGKSARYPAASSQVCSPGKNPIRNYLMLPMAIAQA